VQSSGFPVVDLANLAQSILQVTKAAQQVMNQIEQIRQLGEQIDNQMRELKTLDFSSFAEVTQHLSEQINGLKELLGHMTSITFRTEGVQHEFFSLFPKASAYPSMNHDAFSSYYPKWHQELLASSLTAMKAQGVLNDLMARNAEIREILQQSEGADGTVRQLQVANQLLAATSGHLTNMASALIATGRMTSTLTAMNASHDRLAYESALRARKNYTHKGKPPERLTSLPRFYP
jgi:P-type conjugative transfer protein TrbJ